MILLAILSTSSSHNFSPVQLDHDGVQLGSVTPLPISALLLSAIKMFQFSEFIKIKNVAVY